MSKGIALKAGLVVAIIVAALLGPVKPDLLTLGIVAFGVLNIVWEPAGTTWVRWFAVAASCGALINPVMREAVAGLTMVVWPPAFLLVWSLAREGDALESVDPEGNRARNQARVAVSAVIAAVAVGSLAYHGILGAGLHQSAALFVGIPALLAIVVVFAVTPRSAAGVACKAVTVGLLVSLLFLWEGVVCVLMSAPIFYGVAVLMARLVEFGSELPRRSNTLHSAAVVLLFVPMSLEGVLEWTSLSRDQWVTETRVVQASSQEVEKALFETPRFDRVLPTYLRIGFPRPISTTIESREGTVRWVIRFRGGEMKINGLEPRVGDLVLDLVERQPGQLRWRAISDDSHMTHYLDWREAVVQWSPIDAHTTRVTWSLRFRRGLDPAWYFGPWERYATRLAAGYLIESVATP